MKTHSEKSHSSEVSKTDIENQNSKSSTAAVSKDNQTQKTSAPSLEKNTTNVSTSTQNSKKISNIYENSSSSQEESSAEFFSKSFLDRSEDVSFPQVAYPFNENHTPGSNANLVIGLIAWAFVAIGIAIIILVLLKSKNTNIKYRGKKRYKKNGHHLLSDKYYSKSYKRKF